MREITLEELLEAGCHFGHQVQRSNPKARDYVFEARDGIHIIDLGKTKEGLEEAGKFVRSLAEEKESSLVIVGTKRQASPVVLDAYKKAKDAGASDGLYYMTRRWIGGLFTNFSEVSKNFKKLEELEKIVGTEIEKAKYTKKEIGGMQAQIQKLEDFYGGVKSIQKTPDAVFVIDAKLEELAVKEALGMGVSTVAIVDTNADPLLVDYPIPANDDAVGSLSLITSYIIDSWIEGRKASQNKKEEKKGDEKTPGKPKAVKKDDKSKSGRSKKTS